MKNTSSTGSPAQSPDGKSLLNFCAKELEERKGMDIRTFHFENEEIPFDHALILSGMNPRHNRAMALHIEEKLKEEFQIRPLGKDADEEGRWIVLDYNDFLIHIFYDHTRSFYSLESLWEKMSSKK